jgi:SLAP domain-containing protein
MGLAAALFAVMAATALAADGDVVVLKGGSVIPLKGPWVRKGNTAYLTKPDGTILSVAVSEIDREATDAARAKRAAPPPPAETAQAPSTPADAARSKEDTAKARVRITDSDVSHPMDLSDPSTAAAKDDSKKELAPGAAKVEISTFDQKKEGDALIVAGKLRNPTQELAENVHLNVIVLDAKGEQIESGAASLSNGEIDPGSEVDFKVKIPVGDKTPGSLRFAPTWNGPKPAPPAKGAKPPKTAAATQARASNP